MTPMIMASNRIFYLLFISCNVWYELYPFYQSDAASVPPTNTTASASQGKGGISSGKIVAIVVSISVTVLIFIVGICCLIKRIRNKYDSESAIDISHVDSLQYDFRTIKAATNNFSVDNKLGQGEFGEVYYKGMLQDGQEIAVKRHSVYSSQGEKEFKNEVEMLASLRHRNLARLLGFCVQGEEKILIYEYLSNKSLDSILFHLEKQRQLDWTMRYKIAKGIVRGIQYLHDDSRLRIIHHDLKASNVLLDGDMNPKLSDFGFTIIFIFGQTHGNTDCFVGTFGGYLPLDAMHGEISVKSNVYSFGVLLMEIINGKRSYDIQNYDEPLLCCAWRLWEDGEALKLVDPTIRESCDLNEVMRCIHISLLCVQGDPADRPSMSSVLIMLENYSMTLPTPSQPVIFDTKTSKDFQSGKSMTTLMSMSVNEMSISEVIPL